MSRRRKKKSPRNTSPLNTAAPPLHPPSFNSQEGRRAREVVRKPKSNKPGSGAPDRDFAALLSYGPSFLPYVTAWTDSRVEQVRHFKSYVYKAVDTIARSCARTVPNVTWVHTGDDPGTADGQGKSRFIPRGVRNKALAPLLTHEELEPVPYAHPLLRLLKDPNDPDTAYDLWYETVLFLLLTGSAYWWLPTQDNGLGLPAAIWVVPSHWVWPVTGTDKLIAGYEIRPVEGNYERKVLPAEEVIHFKFKNPVSKLDGFSPLTAISQWADVHESIDKARWFSYKNGTFPTVSVEFDPKYGDPSDEDLRRIESKFYARFVGETRSNKPLFLPPGVRVRPLVLKPNEMLWGDSAKEMRNNILSAYGVPLSVAFCGDSGNAQANLADQSLYFSETVNPLLYFIGQVLTEKLAWRYDPSLRVWWEDRVPMDPLVLERQIQTDLMGAAISANEIRRLRGREAWPYPWADLPLIPVNMAQGTLALGGAHAPAANDQPANPTEPDAPKTDPLDKLARSRFSCNGLSHP